MRPLGFRKLWGGRCTGPCCERKDNNRSLGRSADRRIARRDIDEGLELAYWFGDSRMNEVTLDTEYDGAPLGR
jgi:hypothetical protein